MLQYASTIEYRQNTDPILPHWYRRRQRTLALALLATVPLAETICSQIKLFFNRSMVPS